MCQLSSQLATANQNLESLRATDLCPVRQWEPTGGATGQSERRQ